MSSFIDSLIANAEARLEPHNRQVANKYDKDLKMLPIKNNSHLKNHLNYLFRNDGEQKWTNELTNGNVYIFERDGEFEFLTARNYEERKALFHDVRMEVLARAKAARMKVDDYAARLVQVRSDYLESSVWKFSERIQDATVDFLNEVYDSMPEMDLICAVVHVDQKNLYLHIHLLVDNVDVGGY